MSPPPAVAGVGPMAAPSGAAGAMLALQQAGGNRAVARLISTGELASQLEPRAHDAQPWSPTQPGTQFRLPTAAAIKAMLAAGEVPEDKIKDSISTALTRMRFEKKGALLKTADPIPDIIKRLFPGPGVFDEAEFAKVVDVADRTKIYVARRRRRGEADRRPTRPS